MNGIIENIKNLREITGAGFLDCKKALELNNNVVEDSIDHLRKKGLAKASKKSTREANEGAIGIYSNKNRYSIIKINTETDFAAKNEVFLNFMDEVGNYSLELNDVSNGLEEFNNMIFDGIIIADRFKNIIAKIGENIILNKLIIIANNNDVMFSSYIHNSYRKHIGKIAVVLKSEVEKNNEEAKLLGKKLCMHIAASKPLAMSIDKLDKNLIEKEKEVQLDMIKASGKPENIIEKILEGKMKKFYSESALLKQQFILDSEKSVEQVIEEFSKFNNFKLIDYHLEVLSS